MTDNDGQAALMGCATRLSSSRAYLRTAPLYGVFPGIALMLLIFGLNCFSDALRDAFDPRRGSLT